MVVVAVSDMTDSVTEMEGGGYHWCPSGELVPFRVAFYRANTLATSGDPEQRTNEDMRWNDSIRAG